MHCSASIRICSLSTEYKTHPTQRFFVAAYNLVHSNNTASTRRKKMAANEKRHTLMVELLTAGRKQLHNTDTGSGIEKTLFLLIRWRDWYYATTDAKTQKPVGSICLWLSFTTQPWRVVFAWTIKINTFRTALDGFFLVHCIGVASVYCTEW